MHKLKQSGRLLNAVIWGVLAFSLSRTMALADDFCAVTVHVTASEGTPITSTWIELADSGGKVVRREMMRGPTLKICDFGFGPHTLTVGTNECLPVAVSGLRLFVGSPLDLHVLLDGCAYAETMRTACLLYLRVVDNNGKPIPDVDFSPNLVTNRPPRTDSYGRYQTLTGGSHELVFRKKGFEPQKVHFECRTVEEIDMEVIMKVSTASSKPPIK
jgi:hypothetical protein